MHRGTDLTMREPAAKIVYLPGPDTELVIDAFTPEGLKN